MSNEMLVRHKKWLDNAYRIIKEKSFEQSQLDPNSKEALKLEAEIRKLEQIKRGIVRELDVLMEYNRVTDQMRDL